MMTADRAHIEARALAIIHERAAASPVHEEPDCEPEQEEGHPSDNPSLVWFVAITNSQSERKAAWWLRRRKVVSYFPRMIREAPAKGGGKEVRVSPLFPRYLFVGLDVDAGQGLFSLQRVPGLESVMRQGDEPVRVPFAVLSQLQGLEAQGAFDMRKAAREARFKEGQSVEIASGPFAGLVGKVAKAKPGKRVEVLLSILGGLTSTKVRADDLRAVE